MQIKLFAIEPQTRMHARNQHFSPAASLFLSLCRAGAKNWIHPCRKTDSKGTHSTLCASWIKKKRSRTLVYVVLFHARARPCLITSSALCVAVCFYTPSLLCPNPITLTSSTGTRRQTAEWRQAGILCERKTDRDGKRAANTLNLADKTTKS